MRIKITLNVLPGTIIDVNYQYHLASFVYKTLSKQDNEGGKFLHDLGYSFSDNDNRRYKFFTFSNLNISRFKLDRRDLIINCDTISFIFSTIKDEIAIRFMNGVLKQKTVLSKNITLRDVEIIPEPDFNSGMILKAISPIFITKSDLHLGPNDQYYNEAISINLSSKKTVLSGERRDLNELNIIPIGHIKEKCITIREGKEGECKNKCFTYTFKVEGDPELIEIGYKCGFGKGNAMGFGCVEEVK